MSIGLKENHRQNNNNEITNKEPNFEQLVKHFENLDIDSIVTPVNADVLERMLIESRYDREETAFLVNGFRNGFDIGYEGPIYRRNVSQNIPFRIGNKTVLWNKIMKEVNEKRVAGPFSENDLPFDYFVQSPLGLVPKGNDKTRMIFHLSYDFNDYKSINSYIPAEKCSVKYNDLDHAVRNSLNLDYKTTFYAKTDLSNAFRTAPLNRWSWRWCMMAAEDPETGEMRQFFDKSLPFGGSISCSHYQRFSNCLAHLVEFHNDGKKYRITNYLDDFLFIGESEEETNDLVRKFYTICNRLGVPIATEKTEWATTSISFLGLILDGEWKKIRIPEDKRRRAINMLSHIVEKKKAKVKEMERLSGYLNFLNKGIVPGRAFTRRMYAKFNGVKDSKRLRDYHHVSIDKEFKEDCKVWLDFLLPENSWAVSRPFVDVDKNFCATDLDFFTDASGSYVKGGYGCKYGRRWMAGKWDYQLLQEEGPSINYLELYAVAIAVLTWAKHLRNMRVTIFVDNKSVRDMLNSTTSGSRRCMRLIRIITLSGLKWNTRIFAKYVESKKNTVADVLSRGKWDEFRKLAVKHNMYFNQDPISDEIWPMKKIWELDN